MISGGLFRPLAIHDDPRPLPDQQVPARALGELRLKGSGYVGTGRLLIAIPPSGLLQPGVAEVYSIWKGAALQPYSRMFSFIIGTSEVL